MYLYELLNEQHVLVFFAAAVLYFVIFILRRKASEQAYYVFVDMLPLSIGHCSCIENYKQVIFEIIIRKQFFPLTDFYKLSRFFQVRVGSLIIQYFDT